MEYTTNEPTICTNEWDMMGYNEGITGYNPTSLIKHPFLCSPICDLIPTFYHGFWGCLILGFLRFIWNVDQFVDELPIENARKWWITRGWGVLRIEL